MNLFLNIGLNIRNGRSTLAPGSVTLSLETLGFRVMAYSTVQSDTEPTLAANVSCESDYAYSLNLLAEMLEQDCIAAYEPVTGRGRLIGPKAEDWGPFNPDYFLMLDGQPLSMPAGMRA